MRALNVTNRARALSLLVEGMGINAASRVTGISKTAILKMLADVGEACGAYQDRVMRNLKCKRLQCDEIWSFVARKERNVRTAEQKLIGEGDAWTWTAIDAETKLIPCWFVGPRDGFSARDFINDLASRLANRVQLTTDGLKIYVRAVENAFGRDIDFAQLEKIYGPTHGNQQERKYSPGECCGTIIKPVCGNPSEKHISTSYVERANLTMRMHMRRFTRLTNGHSKKLENHMHAIALNFMFYNFCKIHSTLRVTPAMQAGIEDHVWSMEEVVMMADTMN